MQPNVINPFVKEEKANWYKEYSSNSECRVVWAKGQKAEVSNKPSSRCPMPGFNTVIFVWMHEAQLPINLETSKFLSSDNLEVQVRVELTAQVKKNSDLALISVATRFENSMALVKAEVVSCLRNFCRSQTAACILSSEPQFTSGLLNHLKLEQNSLPIEVRRVALEMSLPRLEKAAEREADSVLSFVESEKREQREHVLTELRDARKFSELVAELKRKEQIIRSECEARSAMAKTDRETEAARLINLTAYARLTDDTKTGIFHINPEIYERIKLAEIKNDTLQREQAFHDIMALLMPFAEIAKSAAPITGFVGVTIPKGK